MLKCHKDYYQQIGTHSQSSKKFNYKKLNELLLFKKRNKQQLKDRRFLRFNKYESKFDYETDGSKELCYTSKKFY